MQYKESHGLRYYKFDLFDGNIQQGIFCRLGGVSPAPWESLNLCETVGDSRENVIENRARIFSSLGRPVESIFDVWQVHGTNVIIADVPRVLSEEHSKADAILTNKPGITLMMRFADCVPIFLHDPIRGVVGLVHAGWKGTVNRIVAKTIEVMIQAYQSNPKDIQAGIGPSIGPDHYEVGEDVIQQVTVSFQNDANSLLIKQNGSTKLDLWSANQLILEEAGVTRIQCAKICTACNTQEWYSHRKENGKTGRFGAAIALKI